MVAACLALALVQGSVHAMFDWQLGLPLSDLVFSTLEADAVDARGALTTLALLYGASLGLAALSVLIFVKREETTHDADTVWRGAFSKRVPKGQKPFAVVRLKTGASVEGHLTSWTTDPFATSRDIALARPLYRRTNTGPRVSMPKNIEKIVLAESEITSIALKYFTLEKLTQLTALQDAAEPDPPAAPTAPASQPIAGASPS